MHWQRNLNILYISKYVGFGPVTPSRQYLLSTALAEQGHKVMLVGSRSNAVASKPFSGLKQIWTEGGLTNVRLNGPSINFGMNSRRILSWVIFELLVLSQIFAFRKFKPDILVVSSLSVLTLLSGVILKSALGCRLVIEIRDIYPLTLIEIGGFSKTSPFVKMLGWVERVGYRNADLLISTLENFDSHVATVINDPPPFEWVPMGFNENSLSADLSDRGMKIAAMIEGFKLSGKFTVIYAGTIGTANALEQMMQAARMSQGSNLHFVMLGDGPLKKQYQAECDDLPNIDFVEPIPKADVHHILKACDLLLLPYHNKPIYRFGISPNKLIDYALSGRPFVTNFQPDLEILRLYDSGFVTVDDSPNGLLATIQKVASMPPSKLKEIGEQGRVNLYRNFRYSTLAQQLVNAFERHGLVRQKSENSPI